MHFAPVVPRKDTKGAAEKINEMRTQRKIFNSCVYIAAMNGSTLAIVVVSLMSNLREASLLLLVTVVKPVRPL